MANAGIPNTTREELFERERGVDPGVRLWDGSRVRSLDETVSRPRPYDRRDHVPHPRTQRKPMMLLRPKGVTQKRSEPLTFPVRLFHAPPRMTLAFPSFGPVGVSW